MIRSFTSTAPSTTGLTRAKATKEASSYTQSHHQILQHYNHIPTVHITQRPRDNITAIPYVHMQCSWHTGVYTQVLPPLRQLPALTESTHWEIQKCLRTPQFCCKGGEEEFPLLAPPLTSVVPQQARRAVFLGHSTGACMLGKHSYP